MDLPWKIYHSIFFGVTENRSSWPTAVESLLRAPLPSLFLTWLSKYLPDNSVFLTEFFLPHLYVCVCMFGIQMFGSFVIVWGFFLFFFHMYHFANRILMKSVIFSKYSFNVTHLIFLWHPLAISTFLRLLIVFLFKIHNSLRRKERLIVLVIDEKSINTLFFSVFCILHVLIHLNNHCFTLIRYSYLEYDHLNMAI